MRNIALMGRSGAGKTTVARLIETKLGHKPCKSGDICRKVSQILYGNEDRENLNSITDALKTISPDILIAAALREAQEIPVLIDSLRYQSDYDFAVKNSFIIIRVNASKSECISRMRSRGQIFDESKDLDHASEVELQNHQSDYDLRNEGTLENLYRSVDALIMKITNL